MVNFLNNHHSEVLQNPSGTAVAFYTHLLLYNFQSNFPSLGSSQAPRDKGRYLYLHFADEWIGSQRKELTCPKTQLVRGRAESGLLIARVSSKRSSLGKVGPQLRPEPLLSPLLPVQWKQRGPLPFGCRRASFQSHGGCSWFGVLSH